MNPIEYTRMYEAEDHHWWYVSLHELILATVQKESLRLGRTLDIFDAGCGTGRLCQLLEQQGHRVTGCDASDEALRLCNQRGVKGVFLADLNSINLVPASFDVITSIDVLYHTGIYDDIAVMERLRSGLKPGGMLIMNLVAYEFLRSAHDIAVHTRERYTRHVLKKRLSSAGLTITHATYRVSTIFPLIALHRIFTRLLTNKTINPMDVQSDVFLPHWLIGRTLLRLMRLENIVLNLITLPFGSSLFVVARN